MRSRAFNSHRFSPMASSRRGLAENGVKNSRRDDHPHLLTAPLLSKSTTRNALGWIGRQRYSPAYAAVKPVYSFSRCRTGCGLDLSMGGGLGRGVEVGEVLGRCQVAEGLVWAELVVGVFPFLEGAVELG